MSQMKVYRPIAGPFMPLNRRGVITSAQYLALFTTGQIIVPAPKTGWANVLVGLDLNKQAGTAYSAVNNLVVAYTNVSGTVVAQIATAGFADQTTTQTRWAPHYSASAAANAVALVGAAPLVLCSLVANPTTGTGNFLYRVWYMVVPMVP